MPGQQPPPAPRHDRQAGLRRPPDERPADGAEHPRVRRRRRPARLPQLGERRRTSPSWRGSGTSSRDRSRTGRPPTHAMQIFRYAEQGSIRLLWIIGTNPAVSLPELPRIRSILAQERLFVVVQDVFLTETARARRRRPARRASGARRPARSPTPTAPCTCREQGGRPARRGAAATWTSSSTTPAGMDFRDKDGAPLVKWTTPEECFEAWKECTRGPALRLQRPELRQAARRQRHPVAVQRRAPGRHRAALRRRVPTPTRTTARPTATTWSPAPPSRADRVHGAQPRRPGGPQGGRVHCRRTRSPATTTRSC